MPSFRNLRNVSSYDPSGHQLCYIDAEEAHRLCADGSHEWRCVSCGNAKGEGPCVVARNHTMAVFELESEIGDDTNCKPREESDCCLTFEDMQRNAGITEGRFGDPPDMQLVKRTQARVRYWAKASQQNRAVTIVPASAL
jgi:hypothetical protein